MLSLLSLLLLLLLMEAKLAVVVDVAASRYRCESRERARGGRLKLVLDETILSLSACGGRMRMSRGGRGGNRRWMMRRVMSLCRGGSGCSGSKYGTGGRGSLGREWRDHRCGYRGGLLTR